jgi:pilus assembly protein FimV
MVAQQSGSQYDDDLTVDTDKYNETFSTEYVDLFEPLGDEDAPIAKLKTIILSIDWEITDDILHQLNEELQDLKDVWSGSKINLIYVQALEKIGRYIFAEKANAHPNAIKLLLTFYYDLEKIVSSPSMDEEAKKQLLLQDVKKFEQFKAQIGPASSQGTLAPAAAPKVVRKDVLTTLKAIVLGIDWEISDQELVSLGEEVGRLEKTCSESRAKLILLQGIGALGNYILSTKKKAHPDSFKLLHSFIEGLDRICNEDLSPAQEKEVLLAEVDRFNAFKAVIAAVASEVVVPAEDSTSLSPGKNVDEEEEEEDYTGSGVITPAFADVPEDVHGFRVDAEAVRSDIDQRVASFFEDEEVAVVAAGAPSDLQPENPEVATRLDALFGDEEDAETVPPEELASEIALAGVNVETEADDDSGEKALLFEGGELAPALAEAGGPGLEMEDLTPGMAVDVSVAAAVAAAEVPGVDVETEADDDSEEPPLPREQEGWVAPALMFSDEGYGFREPEPAGEGDENFDLEDRLDSFFGAEIEESSQGGAFQAVDDLQASESVITGFDEPAGDKVAIEVERDRVDAPLATELQGVEPMAAFFAGEGGGDHGLPAAEAVGVVFEPVGDDVEVDELPDVGVTGVSAHASVLEQESLARLCDYLAAIPANRDEAVFSGFFAEAETLRQAWQAQYIKMSLLQLLVIVCRHIERAGADAESLALLQSLGDNLALVCQEKNRIGGGRAKVLFAEMDKVLLWQQGLILSVFAGQGDNGVKDTETQVMNELSNLFGEE